MKAEGSMFDAAKERQRRADQAEHLRLAKIARETFAHETGERVEPLVDLNSLPDWLVQLRAKGRQALHDYFEALRRKSPSRP
jgi:hypothetical protein